MQHGYEESLREAWPWANAFSRQLHELRANPFRGPHLFFGSDYSGSHASSRFQVYGFVIADAEASREWAKKCKEVRNTFLSDGRRMSFKNLNDLHRRRALIPFLETAESLEGHVVAVAVNKGLRQLSTHRDSLELWKALHGTHARWNRRAFEEMARVAHFFSLFLAAWSSPGTNISWMTDEDDIVANADRLEDAHQFAARLSGLYVNHSLGEFMMNTPAAVVGERAFEDFIAIPDLAAGMVGEVLAVNAGGNSRNEPEDNRARALTSKSDIIADWFWHNDGTLRKTCILIDRAKEGMFSIGQLKMQVGLDELSIKRHDRI